MSPRGVNPSLRSLGLSQRYALQGWGLKELVAPGLLGACVLVGVQQAFFALMSKTRAKKTN